MSLHLNSSKFYHIFFLLFYVPLFVSTDEPLLCFLQVCSCITEIITKSVQFLPTVPWGCWYPPHNPVSCRDLNVTAQGLHLLKEQISCNLSFLYSISGGQRKSWIWCPTFSSILFTIQRKFKLGREIPCEYYQKPILRWNVHWTWTDEEMLDNVLIWCTV